jgi:hypothetical protein
MLGAIATLVTYAPLLLRNPMPQGATSMLAPAKVSPLSGSLRTPKSNHRSQ